MDWFYGIYVPTPCILFALILVFVIETNLSDISLHIEVETKWPAFRGRHIHMYFVKENVWIFLTISLKFIPRFRINNIPALVQIMACAGQARVHYLNKWWLDYWRVYASFGPNELAGLLFQLIFSVCRINASLNWVTIGLDNPLTSVRCQAIII